MKIQLLTDHPKEGAKGEVVEVTEPRAKFLTRYGYARTIGDTPPAQSARKDEWLAWAKANGATDEDLENLTKDELIEGWGDTP